MMSIVRSRHFAPLMVLAVVCVARWANVLFTNQVLLPAEMLRGFAAFGSDPNAPWDILRYDALGQYFPWRTFAARELGRGVVPLWNPHQFAGTPFLANAQSAVLYPLSLPFWLLDPARAFGVSAFSHSLLACGGMYWLLSRWKLSRSAGVVGAVAFGFCGYLSAWIALPTLPNSAAWLPLLLVLLERAHEKLSARRLVALSVALCCALLAGHAQVFVYTVFALVLRAAFLSRRAWLALPMAGAGAAGLGAAQLLPTLELARLGHRAAQGGATSDSWNFVRERALQLTELPSLLLPDWPMRQGSFNENFGYIGFGVTLLAILGAATLKRFDATHRKPAWFALALTLFGLFYALGTPLAQAFYFGVPGLAQMGGVGRALVLWSLGAAILCAFGVDFLSRRAKSQVVPAVALLIVGAELLGYGFITAPTATRETVYPRRALFDWLRQNTRDGGRVLFLTSHNEWNQREALRAHPSGVLPPNGATVYGLYDVSGYDSLASLRYRQFVAQGQEGDVSPPANGNMILLQTPNTQALRDLDVHFVVVPYEGAPNAIVSLDGASVMHGPSSAQTPLKVRNGADFYPGWKNARYQPETFKVGVFLSLCALAFFVALTTVAHVSPKPSITPS